MTEQITRNVECWACGAPVTLVLEEKWSPDRKDACPSCGLLLTDHANAARLAADRMSIEEAAKIMERHTWDDVMKYARTAADNPASLTSEQTDAIYAFCRLRSAQQGAN